MAQPQFPNRIREWRKRRKLTLERLAELAETTYQQISRLEKGERALTDEWLTRLSKPLQVSKADLLYDAHPASSPQPRDGDLIEGDINTLMRAFWDDLGPEGKDFVVNFLDFWAAQRLKKTGTH